MLERFIFHIAYVLCPDLFCIAKLLILGTYTPPPVLQLQILTETKPQSYGNSFNFEDGSNK